MFSTVVEARQAFSEHLDESLLDAAVAGLVPALVFHPDTADTDRVGQTRFGGAPDLPQGASWPRPPIPANAEEIAMRGSTEAAGEMRQHFALGLPYAFMAQIDLAEAAALGPTASVLPGEGRLLFFYDILVGCYEKGTGPCRVVWDRTPHTGLEPCPMPRDLAAAEDKYREEIRAIRAQYDLDVAAVEREGTNYGTRSRPLKLAAELTPPHSHADGGEAFWENYEALPYLNYDEVWQRSKLLGYPDPVQDDPQWDAVVVSDYGVQHLSSDQWPEFRADIALKARDWRLLLQVSLADWMQSEMTEGCVYFLIRHEDLALRRFERVVTVYQQT